MLQPHTETFYCFNRVSKILVLGVYHALLKKPPTKKLQNTLQHKSTTYAAFQLFSRGTPKYAACVFEPQDSNTLRLLHLGKYCQLFFSYFGPIWAPFQVPQHTENGD